MEKFSTTTESSGKLWELYCFNDSKMIAFYRQNDYIIKNNELFCFSPFVHSSIHLPSSDLPACDRAECLRIDLFSYSFATLMCV